MAGNFYNETLYFQDSRTVYTGNYKVIVNSIKPDEIYNLETDPAEQNNLVDSRSYVYSKGLRIINEFLENTDDPVEKEPPHLREFSAEERGRLRALGYIK
ncbi:MAG: hypothetical protein R6V10_08025 [bacterium]